MFGRHFKARGAQGCGPAAARFGYRGGFGQGGPFGGWGGPVQGGMRRPKYNVPLNITEHETGYEVQVYATGFDKANIKLSVTDDVLYISGTRSPEGPEPNFSRQEFPVRNFERMLNLNGQVDAAAISAQQENGVLLITLPKNAQAKQPAQQITVN